MRTTTTVGDANSDAYGHYGDSNEYSYAHAVCDVNGLASYSIQGPATGSNYSVSVTIKNYTKGYGGGSANFVWGPTSGTASSSVLNLGVGSYTFYQGFTANGSVSQQYDLNNTYSITVQLDTTGKGHFSAGFGCIISTEAAANPYCSVEAFGNVTTTGVTIISVQQ